MKIILSRKGFDSGAGGFPNPILPSGRLCVLPIPDTHSTVQYRHIQIDGESLPNRMNRNLGSLVSQLTNRKISPLRRAHLDPDLVAEHLPRRPRWRPVFGQRGAALGHLQKQGVGPGDLFLFFGWFKQTEIVGSPSRARIQYVKDAPDLHVLFGWLQVDKVLDLRGAASGSAAKIPAWIHQHPHLQKRFGETAGRTGNSLYISRRRLQIPRLNIGLGDELSQGQNAELAGAGTFPKFSSNLQLSKGDTLRSVWQLPAWFQPSGSQIPLTYHGDPSRWEPHADGVLLRTVGRGQEFVLDCADYPESNGWLKKIFGV